MRFQHVCIEGLGYQLPEEIITSSQLEDRLQPLYERLRLPAGRLELMTDIRERRVWPAGMRPSDKSIESGRSALLNAGVDPREIGVLIHASVCRDHLEPATACRVHHALGLPPDCLVYDVSNACLGILNGMVQVATLIELGQITAGLVLGCEDSRPLMETTIAHLNRSTQLSRNDIKLAIASLTIGSASCAVVLTHTQRSRVGHRLVAAVARSHSEHHELCQSGADEAAVGGMQPLMTTDSERLMAEGIATGRATFQGFLAETQWQRSDVQRTVCHQVGQTHRRLMLESLRLPLENDFATLEWLGNTGSAALPTSWALAVEQGFVRAGDRVGLLGIGSGINCLMLGVEW